ncbi:MAG: hypothetical protein IJW67_09410 [Blautia sp.]|nr:hypothetical protein [Blautia sp.]
MPVNDSLNNMVCTNTSEAYGLLLTGLGYSFVPGHLLMQHPDLLFCRWKESPKAPFGVYYRKNADADKSSEIHAFMETAQSVYSREQ